MEDAGRPTSYEPMEVCGLCQEETTVPISLHINLRWHYTDGGGQLCPTCYHQTYPGQCLCGGN